MDRSDRYLALIHDLYAAPGSTEGWLAFLGRLRDTLRGSACNLITQDRRSGGSDLWVTSNADPEATRAYDLRWGALDPWANSPAGAALAHCPVIVGDQLIAHGAMQRTAYYQEFGSHYDLVRALIGTLENSSNAWSVITVSGSERRGAFDDSDVALLEPLLPHVRQAIQLHTRLLAARHAATDLATAIDQLQRAVLVIDHDGRVSFMNRAAAMLTSARDGLSVEHGELFASRAADTMRLRALVAEALRTSSGAMSGAGGVLAIGRPSGLRPLVLLIAPAARQRPLIGETQQAAALVFVTDPERVAVPEIDTLKTVFGLTTAEAHMTTLIAQGHPLHHVADRLRITPQTARSRLKVVFQKTNTHRQAELVRLVLNI
jgi:DNA-binding CsgD family transcriptional regulator